jgi:hypothetical protein
MSNFTAIVEWLRRVSIRRKSSGFASERTGRNIYQKN